MLMRLWFSMVGFERLIGLVTMLLMRLLTLDVGGLVILSLMPVVTFLGSVVAGTLLCLIFIGFLLPLLGLLLTLIQWYGLQVLVLRDVARFVLFGIGLFCQGRLEYGILTGLLSLQLLSVRMTFLFGPTLLVFWINGSLS